MNAIVAQPSNGISSPVPTIDILPYSSVLLDQVYDLFTGVRENLIAQGRGAFLLYKDKAHFESPLKGEGGFVVGAMTAGVLTGFCVVKQHPNIHSAIAAKHLTLPDPLHMVRSLCGNQPVAVVQSLCVAPDANGKKIARALLGKVETLLPDTRKLAQASLKNICGWKTFLLSDYIVVNVGTEQVEGKATQKVVMLSVSASERDSLLRQARSEITHHHDADLTAQMYREVEAGRVLVYAPDATRLTLGVVSVPRGMCAAPHL